MLTRGILLYVRFMMYIRTLLEEHNPMYLSSFLGHLLIPR